MLSIFIKMIQQVFVTSGLGGMSGGFLFAVSESYS